MDREHPDSGDYITPPMSLRDYFAGQALAGMMVGIPPQVDERQIADAAYKLADAMLKARGGA